MAFCLVAMMGMSNVSYAATVGEALTQQEEGWRRYNNDDSLINYTDFDYKNKTQSYPDYKGDLSFTTLPNAAINFKFYGTKLRIIGQYNTSVYRAMDGLVINIDGEEYYYSEKGSSLICQVLEFELTNLSLAVHNVSITKRTKDNKYMTLDAIDIDDTGYLVDISQPLNLIVSSGNAKVDLSWDLVEDVESYNIKRSTTNDGPYTTISSVSGSVTSFTDKNVENGKTYYYVVSAVKLGTESKNSNEASATPKSDSDYEGDSAILEIVMTNGTIKEYSLTADELEAFLTWYDNRSDGIGKSYYRIPKKSNIKPFLSRKEYLSFNKIYSFEVKDYNE
ncbi:MAG: hypothetical protein ACERKN_21195 [Velocimicrobium sp.]